MGQGRRKGPPRRQLLGGSAGTRKLQTAPNPRSGTARLLLAASRTGPPSSGRPPTNKEPLVALRRDPLNYKPPDPILLLPHTENLRRAEASAAGSASWVTPRKSLRTRLRMCRQRGGGLKAGLSPAPLCAPTWVTLTSDSPLLCLSFPAGAQGAHLSSQVREPGSPTRSPRCCGHARGSGEGLGQGLRVRRLATSDPSGRCPRRSLRPRPCPGPLPAPEGLPRRPRPAPPLPPLRAHRRPGSKAVNRSSGAGSRPRRRGRPSPQSAPCPGRVVARRARSARGPRPRLRTLGQRPPPPPAGRRSPRAGRAANQRAPSRPPEDSARLALGASNSPAATARAHL